jgi:hypothetical protein
MALALRPRLRPSWMASWKGSQALRELGGFAASEPLNSTPNPVITCMAGFARSVITCMAAFAGACRDHPPGRHTAMPAAFR